MRKFWTVHDAKNRFSKVVDQALRDGPQTITRRGKETAVVLSVDAFRELKGSDNLVEFFQKSPLCEADIDLQRQQDYGRKVIS